ncbi:MAG: hypothetical protein JRN67_01350, partial [Nitrososphaerota archaeon]|nr:hypothetical protein [Nitrososphaerota archaeon]
GKLATGADKVYEVSIASMLENPKTDMVLAILLALPASYFNVREVFSKFAPRLERNHCWCLSKATRIQSDILANSVVTIYLWSEQVCLQQC